MNLQEIIFKVNHEFSILTYPIFLFLFVNSPNYVVKSWNVFFCYFFCCEFVRWFCLSGLNWSWVFCPDLKKSLVLGDLTLTKGDEYEVLDDSQDHWWQVRNKLGEEGFIPSNYVKEKDGLGLQNHDW